MKIKVMRIISRMNVGGPSFHVTYLTEHMNNSRFEKLLVRGSVEEGEGSMDYLLESRGISSVVIPEMSREVRPLKNLVALYKLYKLIRREKPDIVHTHLAMAGFLGRSAAIMAGGAKVVHTFHGHTLKGYWGKAKTGFFATLERILAARSDCLIAVSDRVRRDLIAGGIAKPEKIITIHLGLDLKRFTETEKYKGQFRRELGIGEDTILVGSIARMVPVKNHALLVDAAARIKSNNIKFVIVGDGQLRDAVERKIRDEGLEDKFIFTGFRRDLEKIYSGLDISVISSLNEGLPVAVIESMTAGVPVVSTDVGGVRELIDDGVNGYVVPSLNPVELARKIEKLSQDNEKRNEFGALAVNKVYPYLEYTRLVKDIEDLYETLMAEKDFQFLNMRGFHRENE
ncbi:MAG: glycosyltransferase [candidate division Zixibacteria bacterium]|nr:glycosyltransferase [candidate division Zixibacteria bacterium]